MFRRLQSALTFPARPPRNHATGERRHFRRLNLEHLEARLALASTLPPGFTESLVATNIEQPSAMVFAPDGRIFVAEKQYGVRVVENGNVLPARFVTLQVEQDGERGVENVLFDPNYASNGFVYVYYTRFSPTGSFDRLSRFRADPANPNVALPGETVILDRIQTVSPGYHNGGLMEFGADGMLYLAIGDLTVSTNVQSLSTINGKLLRLNVAAFDPARPIDISNYNPATPNPLVPADNPYVNTPGAWPIIYARGLRNPFTGDVKPGTNTIYINDVGAGLNEEINQVAAGANYGWPTAEGPSTNPAFTNPVHAYPHNPPSSGAAIAGGSFYTGSAFPSEYSNNYFFGDYVLGFIRAFNPTTGTATTFATDVFIPVDIDQGPDGSLYWLSFGPGGLDPGSIYKITYSAAANQPPTAVAQATSATSGLAPLTVDFSGTGSTDPNGDSLTYAWNFGDGAAATGDTVSHIYATPGTYNATLTVSDRPDASGLSNTSQPIAVTVGNRAPTGTITLPTGSIKYKAGDNISFAGTGSDPDDGALPDSAFTWSIVFHHNVHTHPFISSLTGVSSGTFQIPLTGEADPDQWYRVHLSVTDSGGLTHTSSVDILPETSSFTLNTNFAGLTLNLDGVPQTVPATVQGVVGMTRALRPATQTAGGATYNFVSWSDGGAATHNITTPAAATTFTATYALVNSPPVANTDSASTTQETPLFAINVLANDTDANGDALSISSVTQAAHGAVLINADKTLRYLPFTNYLGTDSFTYTISDGHGASATGTVNVGVRGEFFLSLAAGGTIAGNIGSSVSYANADILQLTVEANGQYRYQMYFDGSDVGLTTAAENIDAFTFLPDGSLAVSTTGAFSVPGAGGTTITGGGEDLLRFAPSTLGENTAGTWSLYFDGSDVGLTTTTEQIDGVYILTDGRLIVSLNGNFTVGSNITGQGEDLAAFVPSSLGGNTAGTWSLYFDGSDVGLTTAANENVTGVHVREDGTALPRFYVSTIAAFSVTGVSGQNEDLLAFKPTSLGANTAGNYGPGLTLDGSNYGLASAQLDGFFIGLERARPISAAAQSVAPPTGSRRSTLPSAALLIAAATEVRAGKMLASGIGPVNPAAPWQALEPLRAQRDAFFAALGDLNSKAASTPTALSSPIESASDEPLPFATPLKAGAKSIPSHLKIRGPRTQ